MSKTIHFPGLNGLRFLAALAVVVLHLELFKDLAGLPSLIHHPLVNALGAMGVDLFFVLSGFLITYLLMQEKVQTGDVALLKFYQRRILRIWPVYYLVVAVAFFVMPHFGALPYARSVTEHFYEKLGLYLMILPNGALALFPGINFASLSWSVGVEEQFYLIWPLLIKWSVSYKRPILFFIAFFVLLKGLLLVVMAMAITIPHFTAIKDFLVMTRLECMAIGGLAALLLSNPQWRIYRFVFRRELQWIVVLLLAPLTYLIAQSPVEDLKHMIYAVLFAVLILNTAAAGDTVLDFDTPLLNGLGKISYGIYMYQYFVIIPVLHMLQPYFNAGRNLFWVNAIYYVSSLAILIFISHLSYRFFESWFMGLKKRFAVIASSS